MKPDLSAEAGAPLARERLARAAAPAPSRLWPRLRFTALLAVAAFVVVGGLYTWTLRDAIGFRFAHRYALALVPVALGLIVYAALIRRPQRTGTLRYARTHELGALSPGWVAKLQHLPLVLRLLAVTLAGLAVARPQTSRIDDALELEGIDIVVALDVSGSMEEQDLAPNRLEAAKKVIHDFVTRRPSDRLGLVLFGREAYTYVPPTLDHGTYLRMLADLRLGVVDGKGTAIGNGLGVALARLRRSEAQSKVVILLTDGDNNAGNISPIEAATMAQTLGVKVYTILAGSNDSSDDPREARAGHRYPVNPKLLEQIATTTGGSPYLASDTQALAKRFQSILEELEKSRMDDRGLLYAELYPRFLWPALALLLIELALRLTRWRRLP
ncbi:MAG: VWA domain-containing protein [Myxococcales bacterium]|nr:VWA domain-containing protein [Myxococcales bacterium]